MTTDHDQAPEAEELEFVTPEGNLTAEGRERALAWLRERWQPTPACPFHQGPTHWVMQDRLVRLDGFQPKNVVLGGVNYPALLVSCATCGWMLSLSAIQVGVVKQDRTTKRAPATSAEASS